MSVSIVRRRSLAYVLASLAAAASTVNAQSDSAATGATAAGVRIESFSVVVPDYDEAKRWYVEKLGFVAHIDQTFGQGERFIRVGPADQKDFGIVLQKARREQRTGEPAMPIDLSDRVGKTVNVVLHASDVHAYAATLQSRGVQFVSAPRNMPWGAEAIFKDLYGNSFVIVGPRRTPSR